MPTSSNLLALVLQQGLQRAHPSPLPSNLVITLVESPSSGADVADTVTPTLRAASGMCWGGVFANAANLGTVSYYAGWIWGSGEWL